MARHKKKSYRHYTAKIPIALTVGFASSLLGGTQVNQTVLDHVMRGEIPAAFNRIQLNFLGSCTGKPFDIRNLNITPLLIGSAVSILASKLGINRRLASAGLPIKL